MSVDSNTLTSFNPDDENSLDIWIPEQAEIVEHDLDSLPVPSGTRDSVSYKLIREGMPMADFDGERRQKRYYTLKTYKTLDHPKRNPYTRGRITSVDYYRARITHKNDQEDRFLGGRARQTGRRTRRRRGARRTRNN